jgi:hypothetical protein
MVESQKREFKNDFMQFALEESILECFFQNHG